MSKKELKWGQTPFDELSREELLRHCQRLYMATESLHSVAEMCKFNDPYGPYWTYGAGAKAVARGAEAIELVRTGFDADSIYRSFFRYAGTLLFTYNPRIKTDFAPWVVCDGAECGLMISGSHDDPLEGKAHSEEHGCGCTGTFRALVWKDLEPVKEEQ